MLRTLRKHLQMWLGVPSPTHPLEHQLQTLQDRMDFLEKMIMTARPDTPSEAPLSATAADDLSHVPDAHLGAH
jgi:hypothetical protein